MKVSIAKPHLLLGLQRVQNIVERRTTMPILSNALLKTDKNGLTLVATDLEVGIQSSLPSEIMEPGGITVRARSLLDIVRELPETTIRLQKLENNRLEISAGRSVFNIVGLPAEDFPEIPGQESSDLSAFVRMNGSVVMSMLDKTLYAASTDEARYHLNGVFFESLEDRSGKKVFRMVATDAHRLALVDHPETFFEEAAWKHFQGGIIVPRKGLNELRRLLSEGQDDFFVSLLNKMLLIKRENTFISMRLIEGKYADYRRIVPETAPVSSNGPIQLEREEFLASLRRISLMSSDKSRSVTFNVNPGILQLSSQSPELGDAKEEMNIEYDPAEKGPLRIAFNSRYLMDAISAMEGQKVQLELVGPQNPGVIRSLDGLNHISVVMPMKL